MIFLPIIEYVLETATIFRLQELSDLNNPLLRKLQMNAPGTYHHSISMANLVETIAEEIGEDAETITRGGKTYITTEEVEEADIIVTDYLSKEQEETEGDEGKTSESECQGDTFRPADR